LEEPACQTGGMMSPTRQNAASDSFNEIATVRIELRHTDPLVWRQVEVPTSITLKVLHDVMVRLPSYLASQPCSFSSVKSAKHIKFWSVM